MKNIILKALLLLMITLPLGLVANELSIKKSDLKITAVNGEYTLVITGHDWGPAVSKVIIDLNESVSETNYKDFSVFVKRSSELTEMKADEAIGNRSVLFSYVSDEKGKRISEGNHITLVLLIGPNDALSSPIKYIRKNNRGSNQWVDYSLTITNNSTQKVWDTEKGRIKPLIDSFDLSGSFKDSNDITMSYASFTPKTTNKKSALIIWLHGGGEGGTDPSIPIVANKAANYASDEIQTFFDGAYVLAPQCPGAWMHNSEGVTSHGKENDIYNEGLMELIKNYVSDNPKIDTDRIYVGGCSNGGYMALKLIMLYPKYFAAGYISSLAYQSEYIIDAQIKKIKNIPIWFVHSSDDKTTIPEKTVLPVYKRLLSAGAKNVHLSYYDHVTDLTRFFGGSDYRYNGHWSWIYSHANHAKLDFDGKPVIQNNKAVSIMEWLAAQKK